MSFILYFPLLFVKSAFRFFADFGTFMAFVASFGRGSLSDEERKGV